MKDFDEIKFNKHLDEILRKAKSLIAKESSTYWFPDNEDFYQYLRIKFWKLWIDGKYDEHRTPGELNTFQWMYVKLRAVDFLRSLTKKTDMHNYLATSWEVLEENNHEPTEDEIYEPQEDEV